MNHILFAALSPTEWGVVVFGLFVIIVFLAIFAQYASLWLQCKMTRAGIGL